MINWEVVTWTCTALAVLLVAIGLVLTIISAVNMSKRRKQMAQIHTTLGVGSKVMFAGGIYGKVVRLGEGEVIMNYSRYNSIFGTSYNSSNYVNSCINHSF